MKISELTEIELRKALIKALGWKPLNYESGKYATTPKAVADALNNDGHIFEKWSDRREAWEFQPESDASISEELLEKLCAEKAWKWELHRTRNGAAICIITEFDDAGDENELANERAETTSEARAKAMLQALWKVGWQESAVHSEEK